MSCYVSGGGSSGGAVLYDYLLTQDISSAYDELKLPESTDYFVELFSGYTFIQCVISFDTALSKYNTYTGSTIIDVDKLTNLLQQAASYPTKIFFYTCYVRNNDQHSGELSFRYSANDDTVNNVLLPELQSYLSSSFSGSQATNSRVRFIAMM